jgi:hypothetical protein
MRADGDASPVHVENLGRLFGSNQPISEHFTALNCSDQLQRQRSAIFQAALWRYPIDPTASIIKVIQKKSLAGSRVLSAFKFIDECGCKHGILLVSL